MATLIYVQGLSGRGFRVKDNTGAWKTCKESVNIQVDIDDPETRLILARERDNFIRVTGSGSTTATIVGLTRYGLRIVDSIGDLDHVKIGSGVTTVDLTKGDARKLLKRAKSGVWLRSASATSVQVRGLQEQQNGFHLSAPIAATAVLSSTGTNVIDNDTVTINDRTYRFKDILLVANDVKIGASSDATLDNVVKAVNQTGVAGTDYFAGTSAPTGVSAGARSGTGAAATVTFSATTAGTAGNAFASTEASAQLSFGAATFTGGAQSGNLVKVSKGVTVTVDPSVPFNYTRLRRHFKAWIEA